jgi:hypothetical protein
MSPRSSGLQDQIRWLLLTVALIVLAATLLAGHRGATGQLQQVLPESVAIRGFSKGPNLLGLHSDFEGGSFPGWRTFCAALSIDTGKSHGGRASLKVERTPPHTFCGPQHTVALNCGVPYRITAWVATPPPAEPAGNANGPGGSAAAAAAVPVKLGHGTAVLLTLRTDGMPSACQHPGCPTQSEFEADKNKAKLCKYYLIDAAPITETAGAFVRVQGWVQLGPDAEVKPVAVLVATQDLFEGQGHEIEPGAEPAVDHKTTLFMEGPKGGMPMWIDDVEVVKVERDNLVQAGLAAAAHGMLGKTMRSPHLGLPKVAVK